MNCNCKNQNSFKGNEVADKIKSSRLSKVEYGSKFGEVLYRCPTCEQWWEENLSKATHHDWPPILLKLTGQEAVEKYNLQT